VGRFRDDSATCAEAPLLTSLKAEFLIAEEPLGQVDNLLSLYIDLYAFVQMYIGWF
jgi:hypothetical protein